MSPRCTSVYLGKVEYSGARYKTKIIDDTEPEYFRRVSEYIHLNSVAAKLVPYGKLAKYPWSSYRYYLAVPSKRPEWLDVQSVFSVSGISGVSEQLYMGHFTTVSKAMRFYDTAEGKNLKRKQRVLKFIDCPLFDPFWHLISRCLFLFIKFLKIIVELLASF